MDGHDAAARPVIAAGGANQVVAAGGVAEPEPAAERSGEEGAEPQGEQGQPAAVPRREQGQPAAEPQREQGRPALSRPESRPESPPRLRRSRGPPAHIEQVLDAAFELADSETADLRRAAQWLEGRPGLPYAADMLDLLWITLRFRRRRGTA